jgi:hypothetical protein
VPLKTTATSVCAKEKSHPKVAFLDDYFFELHTAVCAIKIIVTGLLLSSWFAFRKKLVEHIQ